MSSDREYYGDLLYELRKRHDTLIEKLQDLTTRMVNREIQDLQLIQDELVQLYHDYD